MNGFNAVIAGCFAVIIGLLRLSSGNELSIFIILLGILLIIFGVFGIKGYKNKTYYLVSFSLIALFGLISVYVIPTTDKPHIYLITGAFIALLIIYSYSYYSRRKNILKPWKDEW